MSTILSKQGPFGIRQTDQILANDRHPQDWNVELTCLIRQYAIDRLTGVLTRQQIAKIASDGMLDRQVVPRILEDLLALTERDPAAHSDPIMVWACYFALKAIANYRIATAIYNPPHRLWSDTYNFQIAARQLSEQTKVETGVEIHPAAKIGQRCIIDHGTGTVIGETTKIGNDAYILQCVILGGRKIAGSAPGQRHPIIGNNVEIGGFARIFGAVTICNDVFISPHAVIEHDVPDNSRVVVKTTNQIIINH
jgi:serine O-acetyltransferase